MVNTGWKKTRHRPPETRLRFPNHTRNGPKAHRPEGKADGHREAKQAPRNAPKPTGRRSDGRREAVGRPKTTGGETRNMPRRSGPLDVYTQCLRRDTVPWTCAYCGEWVLSKDYERHCTAQHALNAKYACAWCQGAYTWKAGHKQQHADHLLGCWRQAKAQRQVALPGPVLEPALGGPTTPFNWTPLCPKGDWFGHALPPGLDAHSYTEPLAFFPLDPPRMAFRSEALNEAAAALELYDTHDYEWHHLMVRAVVLPQCRAALQRHAHTVGTLPFFCMCDGGREPDPYYRHHRHTIVVSRVKGYLKEVVLPEITLSKQDRPHPHYKLHETDDIQDPMHLLNTMGYVSKRPSRCQFSIVKGQKVAKRLNHFLCHRELPEDFRLALGVVWDGGVMDVVEHLGRKLTKAVLMTLPMELHQAQYRIRVHHMPNVRLYVPLPFGAPFQRTTRPTRWWGYLVPGERTYFEFEDDPDPVYVFYEVRHQWWVPSQRQQNWLAYSKAVYDALQRALEENGRLREVGDTVPWWKEKVAEMGEAIEQGKRENEQWQHKWAEKEKQWQHKLAKKEEQWQYKLAEKEEQWQREKEQWQHKLSEKEETIELLMREMKHLKLSTSEKSTIIFNNNVHVPANAPTTTNRNEPSSQM